MSKSDAGKGDSYRKVDPKKWEAAWKLIETEKLKEKKKD
jgi:hypothetical protein